MPKIGITANHFAFDYFLKDHLGNTRMVLTDEDPNETIPKLDMELADTAVAMQYFSNIASSRGIKPNNFNCQLYATYPDTISYAAKITGVDTAYIGPFAARRVMNGDSITLKVESYYRTHDNNASLQPALTATQSQTALLKQVVAGLVQSGQGSTAAELLADTALQNSVTNYLTGLSVASGKPQAGVYYISLDQQLHYIAAGSGFAQVGSGGCGILNPIIPKVTSNGYMFVFVGNQTQQLFVYYDNLQLAHVHSPVLEETSYYPFGLAMAGISHKAAYSLENKYKYNKGSELQHNEFCDGAGLDLYDTHFRQLDPQIGRWNQIDPKADLAISPNATEADKTAGKGLESLSPYNSMDNNPILHNDPTGDCLGCLVIDAIAEALGIGATGGAGAYASGKTTFNNEANNKAVLGIIMPMGYVAAKIINWTANTTGTKDNGGDAAKHGSDNHNDAIDKQVENLKKEEGVDNIRKNQQQVDKDGNKVGNNRPDLQYNKDGVHHNVEYDHNPANSTKHGETIKKNDPSSNVMLNLLFTSLPVLVIKLFSSDSKK